jgi:hypothetical protein
LLDAGKKYPYSVHDYLQQNDNLYKFKSVDSETIDMGNDSVAKQQGQVGLVHLRDYNPQSEENLRKMAKLDEDFTAKDLYDSKKGYFWYNDRTTFDGYSQAKDFFGNQADRDNALLDDYGHQRTLY